MIDSAASAPRGTKILFQGAFFFFFSTGCLGWNFLRMGVMENLILLFFGN